VKTPSLVPGQEMSTDCSQVERLSPDSPEAQPILEEFIRNYMEQYPTKAMGMAVLHRVERPGERAIVTNTVQQGDTLIGIA
jgi:hypothetical protein